MESIIEFARYRIVSMTGQLSHYGHAMDLKHVPIPETVKKTIIELINEKHRVEDIPGIIRQCPLLFFACSDN